ncbi:MAG: acetyl-CoA carboxylase biotin carboxyl carrier protein subunit [Bacteroidetes bacterium 4572_128]|nr:MAG: acetyl-CoA carboxylase biotin carboxyl carrier protein subunit [Bacteroidetes bacterium 4572_128]
MKNFKFKIRGHKYDVEIKNFEKNIAEIEVNGTVYKVEIDREVKNEIKTPRLVRSKIKNPKGAGKIKKSGIATINAPLPGSIFKIFVKEGDTIAVGDKVLIMEAMKMENNIMSEKAGTIKSMKVAVGDTVLQNDILIEIEA